MTISTAAGAVHTLESERTPVHVLQEKVFEPTEQEKVLFVVAVEDFALAAQRMPLKGASRGVASMAALFDREGVATGSSRTRRSRERGSFSGP